MTPHQPETELSGLQRWLTDALVQGRLPPPLVRVVRSRIAASPQWQATYDTLRQAERVARGGQLSGGQAAMLEAQILDATAGGQKRVGLPVAFVVGAASAAAIALAVLPAPSSETGSEWQARGAHEDGALGLRVRCLSASEAKAQVVSEVVMSPGIAARGLSCPRGDLLAFSVTNLQPAARHVVMVGVTPEGDLRWYAPFGASATAVTAAAGDVDRLLDTVADTSGMPADRRVTLHALFSDRPLNAEEVATRLDQAKAGGLSIGKLDRLPIDLPQARAELSLLAK